MFKLQNPDQQNPELKIPADQTFNNHNPKNQKPETNILSFYHNNLILHKKLK